MKKTLKSKSDIQPRKLKKINQEGLLETPKISCDINEARSGGIPNLNEYKVVIQTMASLTSTTTKLKEGAVAEQKTKTNKNLKTSIFGHSGQNVVSSDVQDLKDFHQNKNKNTSSRRKKQTLFFKSSPALRDGDGEERLAQARALRSESPAIHHQNKQQKNQKFEEEGKNTGQKEVPKFEKTKQQNQLTYPKPIGKYEFQRIYSASSQKSSTVSPKKVTKKRQIQEPNSSQKNQKIIKSIGLAQITEKSSNYADFISQAKQLKSFEDNEWSYYSSKGIPLENHLAEGSINLSPHISQIKVELESQSKSSYYMSNQGKRRYGPCQRKETAQFDQRELFELGEVEEEDLASALSSELKNHENCEYIEAEMGEGLKFGDSPSRCTSRAFNNKFASECKRLMGDGTEGLKKDL